MHSGSSSSAAKLKHSGGVLEEVLGLSSASSTLPALERSFPKIDGYSRGRIDPHWVLSRSQKAYWGGAAAEPEPSLRSADPPLSVATDSGMFYVSLSGAKSGAQADFLDASAGTLLFLSQGTSADESSKGHGSGVGQGGLVGMDPAQLAQTVKTGGESPGAAG